MNTSLLNRRHANASDIELTNMAVDEGYESLAYALACRLEANMVPASDESKNEISCLEDEVSDLESSVSSLERDLEKMTGSEDKLREVVARANKAIGDTLKLINPKDD